MSEYIRNQREVKGGSSRGRTIITLLATLTIASGMALGCDQQDMGSFEPEDERLWGELFVIDDELLLVDDLTAFGSGCPRGVGAVSAVLGEGQGKGSGTMHLVFDEYQAETGEKDRRDYKACNIAVPVRVPKNMKLSLERVDYKGEVYVPPGGKAEFSAEHFFAGKRGSTVSETFLEGSDEKFEIRDGAGLESGCGESVIFRVNTSVVASKGTVTPEGKETRVSVTNVGFRSGPAFHWRLKRCSG